MAPSRLIQLQHSGLTFDVVDSGPVDGVPVVLLHGFPQRASSWAGVSEHLHAHGLRTYAPDQRGYSPGARPRSRFDYRPSELVGDVMALVAEIGSGPVHLVGHDWGAAVAWAAAGKHPDSIRTLTAVSVPHPGAFVRSMGTSTQALKSFYIALFQLPFLPERVLSSRNVDGLMQGKFGMSPEMVERYRAEIVDYGALRGGLGYYRSMLLGSRAEFGTKVSVPTTYVWSDGDAAIGRKSAETTKDWVTGPYEFEVFEGVSHWIPDERPAELAASILKRIAG